MKIEEPVVEYMFQNNKYKHIAKSARVCYASETAKKSSKESKKFVQGLILNNHTSMLRHAGAYFIIPGQIDIPDKYKSYVNKVMFNGKWYVSTNEQVVMECMDKYNQYRLSTYDAFTNNIFVENKLLYYTFIVNTGIDITRELNRKSPNAIAEQSTRYVDFNKKLGIRFKKCHWMYSLNLWKKFLVYTMTKIDEWFYKISRSKYGLNLPPQDARWCLFLDTMSKAVYTYTVKDWEYIINLRLFDYTGKAHPDVKKVIKQIYNFLIEEGYDIISYAKEYR